MANALARGLNTIRFMITVAERETSVMLETSKVAPSSEPLGTVAGVQLAAVFQLLLTEPFHCLLEFIVTVVDSFSFTVVPLHRV